MGPHCILLGSQAGQVALLRQGRYRQSNASLLAWLPACLLCSAGADPRARDLSGCSIEEVAQHCPPMVALVDRALGRYQQNAHLQPGAPCFSCGKAGASKRCDACRVALYCSRTCQRQHWKAHKKECSAASASSSSSGGGDSAATAGHLRLRPSTDAPYTAAIPNADFTSAVAASMGVPVSAAPFNPEGYMRGPEENRAAATRPTDKTFIVKVQVSPGIGGRGRNHRWRLLAMQ